jgi:hypothetical protein
VKKWKDLTFVPKVVPTPLRVVKPIPISTTAEQVARQYGAQGAIILLLGGSYEGDDFHGNTRYGATELLTTEEALMMLCDGITVANALGDASVHVVGEGGEDIDDDGAA